MSQIDASDPEDLATLVDDRSDAELNEAVQAQPGGAGEVISQVLAGIAGSFDPARAEGQQATVQYEIAGPDGGHDYAMRIAGGRCEVERGRAHEPRVTVRVAVADFLRLMTGRADGMRLFMSGKLKVSGDLFFAQTYQGWFTRFDE